MKRIHILLAAALLFASGRVPTRASGIPAFDAAWRFIRADEPQAQLAGFDDAAWEWVTLPHTARVEALIAGAGARQWQGICWYRKAFELPADANHQSVVLRFEGAMNAAEIWVNGQSAGRFMGGYLPYVMDISALVRPGATNVVAVRLDNRDNPLTGPKPLADLDFNLYGGLYRGASLIIKDQLHITDPILADKIAGGGVFVSFPAISEQSALVQVRTHLINQSKVSRAAAVRTTVFDADGRVAGSAEACAEPLDSGADRTTVQEILVPRPKLWSPGSPYLYQVRSELVERGRVVDRERTRVGLRRIEIGSDGFRINGNKVFLRGANRHQEYPYIGNALSDDAQYRDARKIKEAGFDYVRLSHYPQSPAFLDACDELGLVVMDSLMGWQYFNPDPRFAELKLKECRQLIRRDRNHPCVALWEVSLNESAMPPAFVRGAQAAAHEEYPGDQCHTSGWVRGYDVLLEARQHGGCHQVTNRPCLVSEYGDWEYFAQDAGLEQQKWRDLPPSERSSRQLRGDGERRLLQQALNFQEAHNDNLGTRAMGDGVWAMFDYNRGYADDLETSGVMDLFRLPKFAYWFFRTQRDVGEQIAGRPAGAMVFIANYWTPESPLELRVFSNCEEVALYLNDRLVERRQPDASRITAHLKHPPFTFALERFEAGDVRAVGYIGGREAARCERLTPGPPAQLALEMDTADRPFASRGKDAVFCHVELRDKAGVAVPTAQLPVFFGALGAISLVGENPILSEAGTATILTEGQTAKAAGTVYALCLVREPNQTVVLAAAISPAGKPPRYQIRYTLDGSEPNGSSPRYTAPITASGSLRAVVVVNGQSVVQADSRATAASTSGKVTRVAKAGTAP